MAVNNSKPIPGSAGLQLAICNSDPPRFVARGAAVFKTQFRPTPRQTVQRSRKVSPNRQNTTEQRFGFPHMSMVEYGRSCNAQDILHERFAHVDIDRTGEEENS